MNDPAVNAPAPTSSTRPTGLLWPAETLWERLSALCPGLSVEVLPETDSTNTRLIERARAGDASPCLMVAEHQTAGRGRQGRAWQSQPGASLTFSLGLPLRAADWSGLSLVVGLALAEALGPAVRLKWPNDLWLLDASGAGRKLGGILIETVAGPEPRQAVIGVGLNIAAVAVPDGRNDAASLHDLQPGATAPDTLLQLAPALLAAVLRFEQTGFAPFAAAYAARDALAGRELTTTQPGAEHGTAAGVDDRGALLLRTAHGVVPIVSGEVSVRPC